jgi:hypothetical protein
MCANGANVQRGEEGMVKGKVCGRASTAGAASIQQPSHSVEKRAEKNRTARVSAAWSRAAVKSKNMCGQAAWRAISRSHSHAHA